MTSSNRTYSVTETGKKHPEEKPTLSPIIPKGFHTFLLIKNIFPVPLDKFTKIFTPMVV